MREALQVILKKMPAGIVNALLVVTMVLMLYFARGERSAALGALAEQKQVNAKQEEHLSDVDMQVSSLATSVGALVKAAESTRAMSEQRHRDNVEMARQLQRAIDLIEIHIQQSNSKPVAQSSPGQGGK